MRADDLAVRVNRAGLSRCGRDWSLSPARTQFWPDLDLWVLIDGSGDVQTPQGRLDLRPGACLLLRGGEAYTFRQSARRFVHYWIHFDYLLPEGKALDFRAADLPGLHRQIGDLGPISVLLDRVIDTWQREPEPARCNRWMSAAMMEVARVDELLQADGAVRCPAAVSGLRDRILNAPGERFGIGAIAAAAGISRGEFHRQFVRHVGMSPRQFMIAARMNAARCLLRESDYSIGKVATMTGYADLFFFSRHFKQHHGVSPRAYRKGMDALLGGEA